MPVPWTDVVTHAMHFDRFSSILVPLDPEGEPQEPLPPLPPSGIPAPGMIHPRIGGCLWVVFRAKQSFVVRYDLPATTRPVPNGHASVEESRESKQTNNANVVGASPPPSRSLRFPSVGCLVVVGGVYWTT